MVFFLCQNVYTYLEAIIMCITEYILNRFYGFKFYWFFITFLEILQIICLKKVLLCVFYLNIQRKFVFLFYKQTVPLPISIGVQHCPSHFASDEKVWKGRSNNRVKKPVSIWFRIVVLEALRWQPHLYFIVP